MTEDDIRAALAAEAAQAVPGTVVVERLRASRRRRSGLAALVAVAVTAAVAAVVIPLTAGREPAPAPPAVASPPATVLVIGVEGTRADTLMLARVEDGRVSALSLPRDTLVDVPGHGLGKLNSAYALAGSDGAVGVVETLTGQPVDHYAVIDMAGFERLASAVGGVEVCLRAPVSDPYSGADFPAGRQTLSGSEALAFVRQRHGLPNGDLDRVVRQQVYLRSLVGKLASTVLTDPDRREELAGLVADTVQTDSGWSPLALAAQVTGRVSVATIPLDGPTVVGGMAALAVDPAEVREFTADFFSASGPPSTGTNGPSGDGCVN